MAPHHSSARAEVAFPYGATAQGNDPGEISRSWQRCRSAGLTPEHAKLDPPQNSQAEQRLLSERNAELLALARPVMSYVYSQIRNSNSIMLLADHNGFVLDSVGDSDFRTQANRVALAPGAYWAEAARGTNGIGTSLVEGKPIVVTGTEHYLRNNSFLTCAAAPFSAPDGKILGVLDISSAAQRYHPHTFGLVRAAAQMIESRLFETAFAHHTKLRFHRKHDGLGSLMEGIIAMDGSGKLRGANRAAFAMLGLRPGDIGTRDIADCFETSLPALLALSHRTPGQPAILHLRNGTSLHVILDPFTPRHATPLPAGATMPAAPHTTDDALSALDTGDEAISKAISALRRLRGRNLPLLLQGESGTGKNVFARAIHAAGPRACGPCVTVPCATLPETNSGFALYSYLRAASGGILLLDGVDRLSPAMQIHLLRILEECQSAQNGAATLPLEIQHIATSQDDLLHRIGARTFNADLYYRLSGLSITLPPLRARGDLPAIIAQHIAPGHQLSPALADAFARHNWPGNLRQLAAWLRTASFMLDDGETIIGHSHLSDEAATALTAQPPAAIPTSTSLRAQSDAMIADAVARAAGNIAAAARLLGISRNTLYRRLAAMRLA